MLYTRKGDGGTSGLYDTKERLPKSAPVYDALGTLDELNSLLGFCKARAMRDAGGTPIIASGIAAAQECLFTVQAEVAGARKSVSQAHIEDLERMIGDIDSEIVTPHSFVVPGATELSGLLDYARAVCRRAERALVTIAHNRNVSKRSCVYLNRLSTFLYAAARSAAARATHAEPTPSYS